MIVLAIPHTLPPQIIRAENLSGLRKIADSIAQSSGRCVFQATTPRAFLDKQAFNIKDATLYITTPSQRMNISDSPSLADAARLGDKYGWDTRIYRAEYILDGWQHIEIGEREAVLAAICNDMHHYLVFETDAQAREMLKRPEKIPFERQRYAAMRVLRKALSERSS